MMKMVMKINKKFFKIKGNLVTSKYDVTCYTCHHGDEHPLRAPIN
ncbi:MAG: photosynthetic reaction center cytochrome c subunit family protein [Chitinophagaceae bacterium]